MFSHFYSSIQFCAAIVRGGNCGYCARPTDAKWYDTDLRAVVCQECFNPALVAERELRFAGMREPSASLFLQNP